MQRAVVLLKELLSRKKKAMHYPVDPIYPITQGFGVRSPHYKSGIHNGVDYGCPIGTPVRAPGDGQITAVFRDNPTMGNAVYYQCADENGKAWYFRFLHLSRVMPVGDYIQGDIIGYTGNSGDSTGPHLHCEAWKIPVSVAILSSEAAVRANLVDPLTLFA